MMWGTYHYAADNPILFTDPTGMEWSETNKSLANNFGVFGNGGDGGYKDYADLFTKRIGAHNPRIISRSEWGAREPKTEGRSWEEIQGNLRVYYHTITLHHSGNADNYLTIQALQMKEQAAGYADIPYHFAIDQYGNIYEGRPINIKGAHVEGRNTGNIGIVLLADLSTDNVGLSGVKLFLETLMGDGNLSGPMENSLYNLTHKLDIDYGIEYFGGHKEMIQNYHCPGNLCQSLIQDFRRIFKFKQPPSMP